MKSILSFLPSLRSIRRVVVGPRSVTSILKSANEDIKDLQAASEQHSADALRLQNQVRDAAGKSFHAARVANRLKELVS